MEALINVQSVVVRLLIRLFVNVGVDVPVLFCERKIHKKIPLSTFSPAKNGTRMFFVGDHTFFGDVVNIADTLQTICWYKVINISPCNSRLVMFPLKRKQNKKSGLSSVETATTILYQVIYLRVLIE